MILHLSDLPPCWSESTLPEDELPPAPELVPEEDAGPTLLGVVLAAGLGWYLGRPKEVQS